MTYGPQRLVSKMLFLTLGPALARAIVWGLRNDLKRDLPACKSLDEIALLLGCGTRLQRRYQFKPWTARRGDSDFRGLVKRGGIGIGFGRFFQGLTGAPAASSAQ